MRQYFLIMLMVLILPCAIFLGGCFDDGKYNIDANVNNTNYGFVMGTGRFEEGTEIYLRAVPNDGYIFVKWADNVTTNPRKITVNRDITLTAIFQSEDIPSYSLTLTLDSDFYGQVSGGGTYYEGETATISATEKPGFYFTNWSDGNNKQTRQITVTQNLNLKANFVKADLKIWNNGHYLILVNANLEEGATDSYYTIKPKNPSAFGYFTRNGEFLDDDSFYNVNKNYFAADYIIEAVDSAVGFMGVNHDYVLFDSDNYQYLKTYNQVLNFVQSNSDIGSYAAIYKTGSSFETKSSANASVYFSEIYQGEKLYKMELTKDFVYYQFYKLYLREGDSTIYVANKAGYGGMYTFNKYELTVGTKTIYVHPVTG